MKILVLSDTHGRNETMYDVIAREEPFDMLIHCGDIEGEQDRLRMKVDCQLHIIAANLAVHTVLVGHKCLAPIRKLPSDTSYPG